MHITRFGFNLLVLVWLVPLAVIDWVGNTVSTGSLSEYYYWKFILDAGLAALAAYQIMRGGQTTSFDNARLKKADPNDEVMDFTKIGAAEYIYCLVLAAYAAANFYFLHALNKESTGMISTASLIWSLLSIAVAALALMQFWHLKSGKLVELKKRVLQ